MTTDYYKLLEVDREASVDVIEAAYRRLALRYHPDRNTSPDATRRMQEINEAYATLKRIRLNIMSMTFFVTNSGITDELSMKNVIHSEISDVLASRENNQ